MCVESETRNGVVVSSPFFCPRPTQETTAYLQLARAWNLVPSAFLVLAGGVAAAPSAGVAPALTALTHGRLWAATAATGAIALGSMVINDFFDRVSDAVNAPHKPLPSGRVPPDGALLFGGGLYLTTLVGAAWMEPAALRFLVAGSAGVTLVYTPVLKRIPGLKTASVAAVIAAAPAAGAIAIVGATAGITVAAPAVAFAFAAISHRELLMDTTDVAGDAAAGVATLPVLLGETGGLAVAAILAWAAGVGLTAAALRAVGPRVVASRVGAPPVAGATGVAAAAAALATALVRPVTSALLAPTGSPSRRDAIRAGIDGALKPCAAAVVLLLTLAAGGGW